MNMNAYIIAGLFINFVGVLFAVFQSRIKIENRLTTLETMLIMITRNCSQCNQSTMRSSDIDVINHLEKHSRAS